MDLIIGIVVCLVGKVLLYYAKKTPQKKRKGEPIPALLFGSWYYWLVTKPPANTN